MNSITRAFDATIEDVNETRRSVVARINTASRDRYNTVILPRGCKSKEWRKAGGPVLWEHGKHAERGTIPIANAKDLWNNGGPVPTEIIAEPVFIEGDEFADKIFRMYQRGEIRGWSVNILPDPRSVGPPTKEELRSRPDWEGVDVVYREWELAEFSGTTIPGNSEALTADRASMVMKMVERSGLWLPDEARAAYEAALARTMTESVGGLSGGGGLVEPADPDSTCPECGAKGTLKEDGQFLCPAGHRYSVPMGEALPAAVKKSAPSLDLGGARSIVEIARDLAVERRQMQQSLRDEVVAMVDLLVYGRV